MSTPIEFLSKLVTQSHKLERPFVTLSYAQSLDGSLTRRRGAPTRLSGDLAMRMTHALRAWHDGILVGSGTVKADDPQLTVRLAEGDSPRPVVLDTRLSTPATARVIAHPKAPIFICGPVQGLAREALTARGAEVIGVSLDEEGVNLRESLSVLKEQGIDRLMVEGGARVIASFLTLGLADAAVITLAPVLMGGVRAEGHGLIGPMPMLENAQMKRVGSDWVVWGRLHFNGE